MARDSIVGRWGDEIIDSTFSILSHREKIIAGNWKIIGVKTKQQNDTCRATWQIERLSSHNHIDNSEDIESDFSTEVFCELKSKKANPEKVLKACNETRSILMYMRNAMLFIANEAL